MIYFLVYLFIEVFFVSTFASSFGAIWYFFEILMSAIIGFLLLKNFKYAFGANVLGLLKGQIDSNQFMKLNLSMAIGAILLILPGIFTDILGVLLQFPFVSSLMATKFLKTHNNNFKYKQKGETDVIDVEVIDSDSNFIK